jgi:recombinational DNA repair protein (RecF pathway)
MEFEERVIVLRSTPFEEQSEVVIALSESGSLVKAMVQRAKRFGGGIRPFALGLWKYRLLAEGAEWVRLQGIKPVESFSALSRNYPSFLVATFLQDYFRKVLDLGEQDRAILFRLYVNALWWLQHCASQPEDALKGGALTLARYLVHAGLGFPSGKCVTCGAGLSEWVSFSGRPLGWQCAAHGAADLPLALVEEFVEGFKERVRNWKPAFHISKHYMEVLRGMIQASEDCGPLKLKSWDILEKSTVFETKSTKRS